MATNPEVDAIVSSVSDWRGELLGELRGVILRAVPELTEEVKWKMPSKPLGSPVWCLGGNVVVADYLKKAVRLTFFKGALLDDPTGVFNARLDSKVSRAVDYFSAADLDEPALQTLVRQAAALV